MLDKNTMVKVTNRDNGSVGYSIPDLGNLHRSFASGETKEIPMEELRKLSYISGGKVILKQYLVIDNPEAVEELLGEVEPEYYYNEDRVKDLLLNGSLDELMDCLDFAPEGTINLVQKLAVDLKLNDIQKRKAITEKTGFNIDSAVEIKEIEEAEEVEPVETKTRRVATPTTTTATRRTATTSTVTSKYKIVK